MKVNNITIVGGGTAGWLTAAYLKHQTPYIAITLIDKIIPETVGVGEGTLLNIGEFLKECGFSFFEWFTSVDATFKSSILFKNWQTQGQDIWHPFFKRPKKISDLYRIQDLWTQNQDLNFKKYASAFYDVSIDNKINQSSLESYAYHIDCGKLVKFIQNKIDINFINSDVVEVNKDNKNISSILLANGEKIHSDLFVDCTGWKNILGKPNEKIDLQDRLFCNTAIAGHIPYIDKQKEINPYVISEAVDYGWIWNIPVYSRIGSGLVFNRDITDIDTAKKYFIKYWDNRISEDNLKVLDWSPYYYKDMWSGNRVSIGLSAGFIEPLESTGVAMITSGVTQLSNAIREQFITEYDINYFNNQMQVLFEDCADFVSMHYYKNERKTDFWNWVNNKFKKTDRMNFYLELLKDPNKPLPYDGHFNSIFIGANWTTWLCQMDFEIAERNTGLSNELAREYLIKEYIMQEKYVSVNGIDHLANLDRIKEQYRVLNANN